MLQMAVERKKTFTQSRNVKGTEIDFLFLVQGSPSFQVCADCASSWRLLFLYLSILFRVYFIFIFIFHIIDFF